MDPLYSLLPPRKIRLIKGLHVDKEGRLRFNLVTYHLNSSTYVALSYTWGDREDLMWANSSTHDHGPEVPHSIIVNEEHIVMIGENLYSALTSADILGHFEGESRRDNAIWVDQICMDQTNTEDRNTQINQMDTIYTNAKLVSIWFGEEDSTTSRVTEIIRKMLIAFYQRRWFTRVW